MNSNRILITGAVLAMAIAAALPAMASDETTVVVEKHTHHYVYYQDHDVYFAPDSKTYYWKTKDNWQSGAELPADSRSYVTSGGIQVDLDTDRPYEQHDYIVKHYINKHDDSDDHKMHDQNGH
jgi:hypothetical protein